MAHSSRICLSFILFILLLTGCSDSQSNQVVSREIQNLRALAKLYGTVKYFHPSDEAQTIDWNKFAIYGVNQVRKADNNAELKKELTALFQPIAPTLILYEEGEKPEPFLTSYMNQISYDTSALRPVAWQHLGLNMDGDKSAYQSVRINKSDEVNNRSFFVFQMIDLDSVTGNQLRLQASLKVSPSDSNSTGDLLLRIAQENDKPVFKHLDNNPAKSDQWKSYVLEGEIGNGQSAMIGFRMRGKGKFWADNIKLLSGSEESGWEPVSITNGGFEKSEGGRPAGWQSRTRGSYTAKTVSNLAYEGNQSFFIADQPPQSENQIFKEQPKIGETHEATLIPGLRARIPLVLYADSVSTLPINDQKPLDSLQSQLSSFKEGSFSANTESVRLADIIITWNVFEHFFPYFDHVEANWDDQLSPALSRALADKNEEDFYFTLRKFLAVLNDGHIRVNSNIANNYASLPARFDWVEDKVVVTYAPTSNLKRGDIIVSVDGTPAVKILDNEAQYISGSPQWKRVRALRTFGKGKKGTTTTLEIQRDGKALKLEVKRGGKAYYKDFVTNQHGAVTELDKEIMYVDLERAPMSKINEHMAKIADASGVVFDLRGYPNSNHQVINHLLTEPDTSERWMQIPKFIYPHQEKIAGYQNFGWHLKPIEPHIQGNVVFITDGRAISYAESFMSFIEHYKLGKIVGQPTAGTNGNVNTFTLPGGYTISWTGMKVSKHDGSQHHLIGIQPTVPAKPTIEGIRNTEDELLEKAIEIIRK